ncbi:MAG: SAM-dependent chlorinase/fluorinase [Candidatus Polarisedimenticolaceae bacterium]|nr:SAM-dependent chlorinase/fluorinase [Candidatus Polarisedimenticolaceae bacterium]
MTVSEPGIALLTDFGANSPYMGQMQIALREHYLNRFTPIIDLISDLPPFRPDLSAYMISALVRHVADSWLFICVVDPGVGSQRRALVLKADGQWFIGPDNGLLSRVAKRASKTRWWSIETPEESCATFHARDVFAPIALQIMAEDIPAAQPIDGQDIIGLDWEDDLSKIIYCDHYGNLMTGMRAESLSSSHQFRLGKHLLSSATTFSDVPAGTPFWYRNSLGLVEFAANMTRADQLLGLSIGDDISDAEPHSSVTPR